MGIYFDEILYGMLTEDFGGHPFLMRHLCSVINRIGPSKRPLNVDKGLYEYAKDIFIKEHSNFIDMILNVLEEHFDKEYEMLKFLSRGDLKSFLELEKNTPELTNHLIGYGIIEYRNNNYSFRVDTIKNYLSKKEKYNKINLSLQEMINEISERRNNLEPRLRLLIKNQLKIYYGKEKAKEHFLKCIPEKRRQKLSIQNIDDLFNPNLSEIYYDDLKVAVTKNWQVFQNIFDRDQVQFDHNMSCIRKYRIDAHAKTLTKDEMQLFRVCISKIENQLKEFGE